MFYVSEDFIIGYIKIVKIFMHNQKTKKKSLLLERSLSSMSATDEEELGVAGLYEDNGLGPDEEEAEVEDGVDGIGLAALSLPCR